MFSVSLIVSCVLAQARADEPLVVPARVPEPTAADIARAGAMAAGFRAQYPNAFPGGANLAAPPTPPPTPNVPAGKLPPGRWSRVYKTPVASGTATVTVRPDGLQLDLSETGPAGVAVALTLRAEVAPAGRTLYGVVTHVNCANLPIKTYAIEGAPFATSARLDDGKLLLGRVRCEAGESGLDLTAIFSGTYEPAAAPPGGDLPTFRGRPTAGVDSIR